MKSCEIYFSQPFFVLEQLIKIDSYKEFYCNNEQSKKKSTLLFRLML
jgi:hypothetical protein